MPKQEKIIFKPVPLSESPKINTPVNTHFAQDMEMPSTHIYQKFKVATIYRNILMMSLLILGSFDESKYLKCRTVLKELAACIWITYIWNPN